MPCLPSKGFTLLSYSFNTGAQIVDSTQDMSPLGTGQKRKSKIERHSTTQYSYAEAKTTQATVSLLEKCFFL